MHPSYEMPIPETSMGFAEQHTVTPLFSIRFAFHNTIYHAQVFKKETTVMEYHVSNVQPLLAYLPDPFIVASNLRRDLFDFPVNEEYYPIGFGKSVVAAIETACEAKGIPVLGSQK